MSNVTVSLPCVVQLGFAGSRHLFDAGDFQNGNLDALHADVEAKLTSVLNQLPATLGFAESHFLVGISQVACGADTIFTKACQKLAIPQRVFLPQHREAYLSAKDSKGVPDFSADERATAEALLAGGQIIQEHVASHHHERSVQFEQTNVEILRVSDVVICLLQKDAVPKAGGTNHLLGRAKARKIPVLEIRVGLLNNEVNFDPHWHNLASRADFTPPQLPAELSGLSLAATTLLPSRQEFCKPLEELAEKADRHQFRFKFAAALIILTHLVATVCAASAVAFHRHKDPSQGHEQLDQSHDQSKEPSEAADSSSPPAPKAKSTDEPLEWPFVLLLSAELVLLATGFLIHRQLHHAKAVRVWAASRIVSELVRSLDAIGDRHLYLEHFFRLSLPHHFRPLLRTLNVLHLRSTWPCRNNPWQPQRDQYVHHRFICPINSQPQFYRNRLRKDEFTLLCFQWVFVIGSLAAILATLAKLTLMLQHGVDQELLRSLLGVLAISLPVLAVSGLSWAAALDCEARIETFGETLRFLEKQMPRLQQADSAGEFEFLLVENETELLAETASWYSRRSNTEVN